jgi:hypothetical protein
MDGEKLAVLSQIFSKNACEIFHDKADFAALTPSAFRADSFFIVGIGRK